MRTSVRTEVFILFQRNIKAKTGLEEAVVNQATVWPESGADRAAASRENPVLFPAPQKKARQSVGLLFVNSGNGLEEAVMNQAPVGLENGADRAATSRENPVLFPAPNENFRENGSFYLLQRNIKAKTGLEEAIVNQATVWPESGGEP